MGGRPKDKARAQVQRYVSSHETSMRVASYRTDEPVLVRCLCAFARFRTRLVPRFTSTTCPFLLFSPFLLPLSPAPLAAACAVVVLEMAEALRTHRAEKYRKLTPDESIGALEWACGKIRTEYGLQMRNNK